MNNFAENNPILLKEWDYTKNNEIGIYPTNVAPHSEKKVWWICPNCGNSYRAAISHRSNGTACPKCANEMKTSFGEQAIYFYLSKLFKAENRWNVTGSEVDIFLYDLSVGIEYDGEFYHTGDESIKREKEKYDYLKNELGIKLIRVKENFKKIKLESNADYTIEINKKNYDHEIPNVIYKIIKYINSIYGTDFEIEVDLKKDRQLIYQQYIIQKRENSIEVLYPELLKEWDYEKNKIKPSSVTPGSYKMIWWKCEKEHNYEQQVANHIKGARCPICANQKALKGYNDLETRHPELLKEWDYEKNNKKPDQILPFTNKKYYWICPNGHSYLATPNSRLRGRGCPICIGKQIQIGYNDLKTLKPELLKEWDYEKNKKGPECYTLGSDCKVYWICPKGHNYSAIISHRVKGTGCPICNGKVILEGYNDFQSQRPDLLIDWDYENNEKAGIYPNKIHVTSMKYVYWRCHICGYKWKATLYGRCGQGKGCNVCSSKLAGQKHIDKIIATKGSLSDNYSILLREWDYEKNKLDPSKVTAGSHKRSYWICSKCGYKWNTEIRVRAIRKNGCPNCHNKILN